MEASKINRIIHYLEFAKEYLAEVSERAPAWMPDSWENKNRKDIEEINGIIEDLQEEINKK